MSVLTVSGLCKHYPAFDLQNVSFSLAPGKITGFIGRNGAGKSTTLNSLLEFVHPDAGRIEFFGQDFAGNQLQIKQRLGFVSSGVNYYPKSKLRVISAVTRSFYPQWDQQAYQNYLRLFELDENKTPSQLSAGMRVKYALALALSHRAELLILDEPTSGLDPVSREDLLEVFMDLCDQGSTILFSTHITSDLDKCADNILYIKQGRIQAECSLTDFAGRYQLVAATADQLTPSQMALLIGKRRSKTGFTALVPTEQAGEFAGLTKAADLEAVMVHLEKEEDPLC